MPGRAELAGKGKVLSDMVAFDEAISRAFASDRVIMTARQCRTDHLLRQVIERAESLETGSSNGRNEATALMKVIESRTTLMGQSSITIPPIRTRNTVAKLLHALGKVSRGYV